jgi:RNA polymerase sigma factor (sigma-70 family)
MIRTSSESPPSILAEAFAKPGREWSQEQRVALVEWMLDNPRLRAIASRLLPSKEDAEDAYQDFLAFKLPKVVHSYQYPNEPNEPPFSPLRTFLAYCLKSLHNHHLSWNHRALRQRARNLPLESAAGAAVDPTPHTELLLEIKEILSKLSMADREIVELNSMGFTTREIASKLSISPQTADVRLYRARSKMRASLRYGANRRA